MKRKVQFGAPFIGEEERRELLDCIDSGWLGTGPRVARFEEAFRKYVGAPAAVAVASGSAALHLSLLALDLPAGSEVITTSMTFCATANAIVHAGLVPVFADCDPVTMNIDPRDVERKLTGRTRALLPVHLGGRPCDMVALRAIAQRHHLRIVEDCAHAIEARIGAKPCGSFGDFGCYSFHVTKNLTTVEGGMILCPDPSAVPRLRALSRHGVSEDAWARQSAEEFHHYEVVEAGFKYNLTDLAASFGLHQLARLHEMYARRRALWTFYKAELSPLPLQLPAEPAADQVHALHLFSCLIDDQRTPLKRDDVVQRLAEAGIGTGIHYRPVHEHAYYRRKFPAAPGSLPVAESIGRRTFSLPFSGAVSDADAAEVVSALRRVFA